LAAVAVRLRDAANGKPVDGLTTPAVLASVSGLLADAQYVETCVEELRRLIPEDEVELEED